jgi:hypothetical protein
MSAMSRHNLPASRRWLAANLALLALVVPEAGLSLIAPALLTTALLLAARLI